MKNLFSLLWICSTADTNDLDLGGDEKEKKGELLQNTVVHAVGFGNFPTSGWISRFLFLKLLKVVWQFQKLPWSNIASLCALRDGWLINCAILFEKTCFWCRFCICFGPSAPIFVFICANFLLCRKIWSLVSVNYLPRVFRWGSCLLGDFL